MSHTPGPWVFDLDDDGITDVSAEVFVDDDGPGRCVIARIEPQPQVKANARLIAVAPELLASLRAIVYIAPENPFTMRDPRYSAWPQMLASARAVIAKVS